MVIDYNDTLKTLTDNQLDSQFEIFIKSGRETKIKFYNLPDTSAIVRYTNRAGKHKLEAEWDENKEILTIRYSHRITLNQYYVGAVVTETNNKWQDPYYAISQTFTAEKVDKMEDEELSNLIKLAKAIQKELH